MVKRLLIVSPNFPPKSTADMHRVRMSLPHYASFGWEPTVLAVTAETCEGIDDPLLAQTLPEGVQIIRVPAWDETRCRKLGFGLLEYRALWPLYRAGNRLLREGKYDLIFFSTTAFLTLTLGSLWRRRFGAKLVYDIQDPWYQGTDQFYEPHNAPGVWVRYRLSQKIARHAERFAMSAADAVISVSPVYANALQRRYGFLRPEMFEIIPFGITSRDYDIAGRSYRPNAKRDGARHWVSVGRIGVDMEGIVEAFFAQLARLKLQSP